MKLYRYIGQPPPKKREKKTENGARIEIIIIIIRIFRCSCLFSTFPYRWFGQNNFPPSKRRNFYLLGAWGLGGLGAPSFSYSKVLSGGFGKAKISTVT